MTYEWKRSMPVKAQAAGERLESLERQHGSVTPKLIVDDARPEDAILHTCFEWNDEAAAEKYRETQAGYIVRNLVVVKVNQAQEESEVRAFVSIANDENKKSFVSVTTAMSDIAMRNQILDNALSELASIKKKYGQLKELAEVFAALDKICS